MTKLAGVDPPILASSVYHGGDLAAARAAFPAAPEPWLDLSTGINPNSYPLPILPTEAWTRLPDPAALTRLEAIAAKRYRVGTKTAIVAGPGAQALIQLLPRLLPAKRVGILGFTYGEYEQIWRGAGAAVTFVETVDQLAGFDIAIVVNPNNPDGRLIPRERLAVLAETLAWRAGALVVDEAFIDAEPAEASLAPQLPASAIVLRSFGKIYGLAGLRLGFAIADTSVAAQLRVLLGPWAVSGPAIEIGAAALADEAWLVATTAELRLYAAALDKLLVQHGFAIIGGAPLFRLATHTKAQDVFKALGRQGVLIRRFPTKPDWLRFGLPADEAAFARLDAALSLI